MAEITKELGRIPVSRGDYQSTTEYYKDNIVQYKRGSYQVVSESPIIGIPPTNDKNIVNPGWTLFAGTLDAQDVVNQIKEQEAKSIQAVAAREAEILAKSDAAKISSNTKGLEGNNVQDNLNDVGKKLAELDSKVGKNITERIYTSNDFSGLVWIGGEVVEATSRLNSVIQPIEANISYRFEGQNITSRYLFMSYPKLGDTYTENLGEKGVLDITRNTDCYVMITFDAELEATQKCTIGASGIMLTKLDNNFCKFKYQEITITEDYLTDVTNLQQSYFSSFQTIILAVTEGEKYKVSCNYLNDNYAGIAFWSNESLIYALPNGGKDVSIEVPVGATRMIVNGRVGVQTIEVQKFVTGESSDFWKDYSLNQKKSIGVSFEDDVVRIFSANYAKDTDLECVIRRKSGNNLPDIYGWYRCQNSSGVVLTEPSNETDIVAGTTDFLSPSIVYAKNNVNGSFPDFTSGKLTGGWHMYNNAVYGNYSSTARNVSYKVFCDGVQLNNSDKVRGNSVVVEIINRLQGSNTELENGGGREIIEQKWILRFKNDIVDVQSEITALEDVEYSSLLGISMPCLENSPFYFVGCREKRGAQTPSDSVNRCGDKFCHSVRMEGEYDRVDIGFDTTLDLGTLYANHGLHSFTSSAKKVYTLLIDDNESRSNRVELTEGDVVYFSGFYRILSK